MADASKLLRAYLVVGTDELKRRETINRLKRYVDGGLEAFNLDERVASPSMDAQDILSSLTQFAMGAPVRLVIIEQAEKLPKAVSETIIAYLENPNPTCTLALVADSLAKTTRLYKAVAKQGEKAIISCEPIKRWELPAHVVKIAKKRGVSISQDAAAELVSRVGESTTMLDTQLRTLIALTNGAPITRETVEAHVARVAEVSPFDFLDAYFSRDVRRALELYRLMDANSEIRLLSLLATRLREVLCAHTLAERGQGSQLASVLADYDNIAARRDKSKKPRAPRPAWQFKNHAKWARMWREEDLIHAFFACASCEKACKSSSDRQTAFVKLLIETC